MKGDKVVAFCDRNCNVIAPFVAADGNRNESPLPKSAMGFGVMGSCGVDSGLPSGFALRNEQRRLAGPVAAGLAGGSGAIETFCA
jgi:hypothetical protein